MKHFGIKKASDVLMIGDRMCKDGRAAKNIGADYLILSQIPLLRMHSCCKIER